MFSHIDRARDRRQKNEHRTIVNDTLSCSKKGCFGRLPGPNRAWLLVVYFFHARPVSFRYISHVTTMFTYRKPISHGLLAVQKRAQSFTWIFYAYTVIYDAILCYGGTRMLNDYKSQDGFGCRAFRCSKSTERVLEPSATFLYWIKANQRHQTSSLQSHCSLLVHCNKYPYINEHFVASLPYFNGTEYGTGSVKILGELDMRAVECRRSAKVYVLVAPLACCEARLKYNNNNNNTTFV